jgi:membrane protease YdiL (CAAX protease family)
VPHPQLDALFGELVAIVKAWLLVAAAGGIVALTVRGIRGRSPILPVQRMRAPVWTGPLVAVAFVVFAYAPLLILPYIDAKRLAGWFFGNVVQAELADRLAQSMADVFSLPFQIAAWAGLLVFAGGRAIARIPRRPAADYLAGYTTWLLLAPFVYTVSMAAGLISTWLVGRPPDEHPIVRALQTGPPSASFAALLFVQAVIVAPVREEVFFRGIMQPFFASRPWGGDVALWIAAVLGLSSHWPGRAALTDWLSVTSAAGPLLLVMVVLPLYRWLDSRDLSRWIPVKDAPTRRQVVRGIVGTSLLFANMHASVWPTPIPLFFLALGLGRLAFRTQGVLAPIVLHVLFNAIVFAAMAWRPQIPPPMPPAHGAIGNSVTVAVTPTAPPTSSRVPGAS